MTGQKFPQPPNDPTPDWEVVRQQDPVNYRPHVVPVKQEGLVFVKALPAKRGTNATIAVDTLVNIPKPMELIPADPRLRRVWISVTDVVVVVGTLAQVMQPNGPQGYTFSNTTPMPWEGFEEPLYGVCKPGGTQQQVSLRYEYWAD